MNKQQIKFSNKKDISFITELRQEVKSYLDINGLKTHGSTGMIMKSVFMLSLYFVPYAILMSGIVQTLPGLFAGWVVMGLGMAGVGLSVMHDANHRTFSGNKHVNKWFAKSMFLVGGFPLVWQHQHNTMHHGFTNIEGMDEDIDPGKILRFSPHKPLYKMHRFQHLYFWVFYSLSTLSWITAKEFRQLYTYNKENVRLKNKSYGRLYFELIISKLFYYTVFLVLPLLFMPFAWYWVVAGFLAMHFTCGLMLSLIFGSAHIMPDADYPLPNTENTVENNWAIHQLLTTTNFSKSSRLFTWLIGGLNYQIEHHLFPNICHMHYRSISFIVKETALKYGLPYYEQKTFYGAVKHHVKMLKILGRQKEHRPVVAPVPVGS